MPASIPPARRRNRLPLSDEVAAHVRAQIMSGSLQPGEFVRLEKVADDLGVSATPVREGLHALRGEGFLGFEPRRGFVVAPLSPDDIEDLFLVQADIAGELAARAAIAATPEVVDELRRLQAMLDGDLGRARRGRRRPQPPDPPYDQPPGRRSQTVVPAQRGGALCAAAVLPHNRRMGFRSGSRPRQGLRRHGVPRSGGRPRGDAAAHPPRRQPARRALPLGGPPEAGQRFSACRTLTNLGPTGRRPWGASA